MTETAIMGQTLLYFFFSLVAIPVLFFSLSAIIVAPVAVFTSLVATFGELVHQGYAKLSLKIWMWRSSR